jgi:selenide,water dikinase
MKVDYAKRRRVMERSKLLGHCLCDVRRPCPCDVFRDDGICPCAGERPDPVDLSEVRLTQQVRNAGCASKIAPGDLDAVLSRLPPVEDPAVISGLAAGDDAAIYRITDGVCLVQTVDVFTPCVDDPRLFGRICAANCLSDIYAMGGEPRTALSVMGFPSEKLPGEVMFQMLAGAMETFGEAGVALVGGHSVKDDEIKLGFAITGLIDPRVAAGLERLEAGNALVLTKPLGTGVLNFCQQIGRTHPQGTTAASASMAALNAAAAEAMKEAGASACTDVTGFGLFAHLYRLLRTSRLSAEVFADALPAFAGALEALRQGVIPGAIERNREYVGEAIEVTPGVDEALVNLGFDAQTSGGLLIAVPAPRLAALQRSLARRGADAFVIGRVMDRAGPQIRLVSGPADSLTGGGVGLTEANTMKTVTSDSSGHHEGCCADVFQGAPAPASAAESQRAFGALMRSVQRAGTLSEKAKELILFGLVLQSRCAGCFDAHFARARELGITRPELDEAAWCAIAMGGAPVRVFYQECLERSRSHDAAGG